MIGTKFPKRTLGGRVYEMVGGAFDEMKNAVKTLGGRYDSQNKLWLLDNASRKELRKSFTMKENDFIITISSLPGGYVKGDLHYAECAVGIVSRFTGEPVFTFVKKVSADSYEAAEAAAKAEAQKAADEFVVKYNESDDSMIQFAELLR